MIFVLNRDFKIILTLRDDEINKSDTRYFNDVYNGNLETGTSTFKFSAPLNSKTGEAITGTNYIVYKDDNNKFKLFQIMIVDQTSNLTPSINVYCESADMGLLYEPFRKRKINPCTVRQFLNIALAETDWNIGYIDDSLTDVITISDIDYDINIFKLIQQEISKFNCDIEFTAKLKNGYFKKYVNVYKRKGKLYKTRLEIQRNTNEIIRTIDFTNVATALIGRGKDGLKFTDIEINGLDKPVGQDFICDIESFERYNINGRHLFKFFDYDTDSPYELLRKTNEALQTCSKPAVKYDIKADLFSSLSNEDFYSLEEGDTFYITDYNFVPALFLEARVSDITKSRKNKSDNKVVFSNYKEMKSRISNFKMTSKQIIEAINNNKSENINSEKIIIDDTDLSSKISEITDKQDTDSKKISSNTSKIESNEKNISLKVDSTIYEKDKTNLTESINKNSSEINVLKNGIAAKVEKTDIEKAINEIQNNVDEKINTAKSEINIETDSIKQSVTKQTSIINNVKDKVENLDIGTRNYVKNSAFLYGNTSWIFSQNCTIDTNKKLDNYPSCKVAQSGLTSNSWRGCINYDLPCNKKYSVKQGDNITISCWYFVEDKTLFDEGIGLEFKGKKIDNTNETSILTVNIKLQDIIENKWTRISLSGIANSDYNECCIRGWVKKNGTAWFTKFKLSNSNILTDWTSAIEDTDENINNVVKNYATKSELTETSTNLELKFDEVGGYNLLRNSTGLAGDLNWTYDCKSLTGYMDNLTRKQTSSGSSLRVLNDLDIKRAAFSNRFNLQSNKTYTISGKYYVDENSKGTDIVFLTSNSLNEENGLTDTSFDNYYLIVSDNKFSDGNYKTFKKTITTTNDTMSGLIRLDNNGTNNPGVDSFVDFADTMIEEGEYSGIWSSNPSEIYGGIIHIDKNGIKVSSTNSNTHTIMDSDSFRVEDSNGSTLAEFDENAYMPEITSNVIHSNEIYASNIPTKKQANGNIDILYVNRSIGDDNNNDGLTINTPFKTIQKAIDQISDLQNRDITIKVSGNVNGFDLKGKTGIGIITLEFEDDVIVNGRVVIGGCTSKISIKNTNGTMKSTFIQGIAIYRCMNVEIYGLCFRGLNSEGSNIYIRDTNYCSVSNCDLGGTSKRTDCAIKVQSSLLWFFGCIGSNILDVIGQFEYSNVMMSKVGNSNIPDYSNGLLVNYDRLGRIQNSDGGNFIKTPSSGWNPTYSATSKTSTWNFNKIWSDETLKGWGNRNELIQGYYSGWSTGRWTGYIQMQDNMESIRNALNGATNLSGRIYIQRTNSSGQATGSKLYLFGSDGSVITTTQTINKGQGIWVNIPSLALDKILKGTITYFYLRADTSNQATYFKCQSNVKIEITYTN